jgi:CheY-like chemotaxis protein
VARVLALIPDLLFGSRVQAAVSAAGHEVELVGGADAASARAAGADVLIVDLVSEELDGAAVLEAIAAAGGLGSARTLGFYSHVDAAARTRAERAGFDLVVPRSRMAREGPELVARLVAR